MSKNIRPEFNHSSETNPMTIENSKDITPEEKEALAAIDSLVKSAQEEAQAIATEKFVVTDEDVARMEAMIKNAGQQ